MNVKSISRFLVLLLLLVGAASVQAQEPPPQINNALADLGQRLQTTIQLTDLTRWDFQQNQYTDTSLGCNLITGQALTQSVTGYQFNLEYQGTTYDYRVSAEGSIVIACNAALLETTPVATTIVETQNCPAGFAGFLTPRLQVNNAARVIASNGAPNRLRDAPATAAAQIGQIAPNQSFNVIGGPTCADNIVWWQVISNGQTGWTAEGQLPDDYFLEPVDLSGTATATATAAATIVATQAPNPTLAPVGTQPPIQPVEGALNAALAGVSDSKLTLFNFDADGVPAAYATVADVHGDNGILLDQLAWSPDGQHLAYTVRDANFVSTLFVTDRAGGTPVQLATDLYPLMPVSFTADSAQVLYAKFDRTSPTPTPNSGGPGVDLVQIATQPITPNSAGVTLATVPFGVGCGGGSGFPGTWQYNTEAGYEGHAYTLAMTSFGVLYSNSCNGIGTALLKLDSGQSTDVGVNLSRASVSVDGMKVVGISAEPGDTNRTLTVVDLQTLQQTPLGAVAAPEQVAWGPDGAIYYTTSTDTGEVIPGSDNPIVTLGNTPSFTRRSVSIHRVDVVATTDAEIYTASAYAIGRLFVTPDNQAIYFSSIPNADRWVDALVKGVITQQSPQDQILAYFPTELYRIALASNSAQQVSGDLAKATLNRGAFQGTGSTEQAQG